jgi:hypothetical protein
MGISLRHSLHFFVVGSTGSPFFDFEIRKFIGLTTKKNTVVAISKKEINAFKKCPYINLLSFIVKNKSEKSGTCAMADINGVNMSETKAVTTVPNAAPITTPTARSTTFPLSKNCLNSLSIFVIYEL